METNELNLNKIKVVIFDFDNTFQIIKIKII